MATIDRNLNTVSLNTIAFSYIGFVKRVDDGKRAGRIQVWIPDLESPENDESGWIQCEYCSPFAGVTNIQDASKTVTDTDSGTQSAYGFFATVPDLNNEVVVIFIGGDIARAVWIGCLYGEYMMHQVPGIASSRKNKQTGNHVPVTEYNKWDKTSSTALGVNATRPWNEARTTGIGGQGLIKDHVRGLTTSSAMRESPSSVVGIVTPGRKKGKSRTGGHSFVMDDGDVVGDDSYIGFRTTNGASIRIDDKNGLIYAINSKGTSWIQMDEEGNVDIFGAKSVSVRSQEDINLRADKDINIEAGQNINMKAAQDSDASGKIVGEGAGVGGNIKLQAVNEMHTQVQNNTYFTVTRGNLHIDVQVGTKDEHVGGDVKFTTDSNLDETVKANSKTTVLGNYDLSVTGDLNLEGDNIGTKSLTETNIQATGDLNLLGLSVNINSGGAAAGAAPASAATPIAAVPKPIVVKENILAGFAGTATINLANSSAAIPNYWDRKTEPMQTIVNRLMTYEPCPEHKNKGGQ